MSIYLDNAATTPVLDEVVEAMSKSLKENYGNPSSVYKIGRENKVVIEATRETVAKAINAKKEEIIFTSGGTESDNWAIKGVAYKHQNKGKHIITTKVEHHAVLHTCEQLEKEGFDVTYLDVDKTGRVSVEDVKNAIRPDTILITIMFANNEIGTIMPISEIGAIAREKGIFFHTDAVQAFGHINIDVEDMNIDLLSLSGHKVHGPKGIGALYIRKGVVINNLITGGAQERRKRAGTENVASIVGLGVAVEDAIANLDEETKRLQEIRDYGMERLLSEIPYSMINGNREHRLPGNINVSFDFIEGESVLLMLDMKGIYASSGSACTSGSLDPSHVLLAMGLKHEEAHGSIRLSLGKFSKKEDIDTAVDELKVIVERLRSMSPLYEDFIKGNK